MKHQARGFLFSSVIHAVAVSLIVILNGSMVYFNKPVEIDFSIEDPSSDGSPRKKPGSMTREPRRSPPELPSPEPVKKQEALPRMPVLQQVAATSETSAESQAPVAASAAGPSIVAQGSSSGPSTPASPEKEGGPASAAHGEGGSGEAAKQGYLKEHFTYIRNIVQKKLSYPAIARKMGWEGKVLISFIVCTDGHVKEIAIREGSGIDLLDRNAVAAVQSASPFPRPPVEARLIIPISYSLN